MTWFVRWKPPWTVALVHLNMLTLPYAVHCDTSTTKPPAWRSVTTTCRRVFSGVRGRAGGGVRRSGMACFFKGSHSFTCKPRVHPLTEWTTPAFAFPAEAGTHLPTQEGWKAELPWVAGWLHTEINVRHRELNPDTVAHLSTNRARRWLTSLIEANALYHYAWSPRSRASTLVARQFAGRWIHGLGISHLALIFKFLREYCLPRIKEYNNNVGVLCS